MSYHQTASALPVMWTKASASNPNDNRVELADHDGTVVVRDSKNPDGPAHGHRPGAVGAFPAAITAGQLVPVA
ncbi:DUF397 domain-containing protein [Kitasatospora sp. NPDC051984]|uniref:DUF397 domain-containing protein n=1 Tax=Kitasatospora sp. NPDC051984 TaxID=3364059 RepID=UPI0037C93E38